MGLELCWFEIGYKFLSPVLGYACTSVQGPVVQKPVNANLGLKVNQGFCFFLSYSLKAASQNAAQNEYKEIRIVQL